MYRGCMKGSHLFLFIYLVVVMYEYSKLTYYYMMDPPGERSTRHMWNPPHPFRFAK